MGYGLWTKNKLTAEINLVIITAFCSLCNIFALSAIIQRFILFPILSKELTASLIYSDYIKQIAIPIVRSGRTFSVFTGPNSLGICLAMSILCLLFIYIYLRKNVYLKILLVVSALLQTYALFLTRSLSAILITLILGCFITVKVYLHLVAKKVIKFSVIIVTCILITAAFTYKLKGLSDTNNPIKNRLSYWKTGAAVARKNWPIGTQSMKIPISNSPTGAAIHHAHNIFIEAAARFGLVGLVAILIIYGLIILLFTKTVRSITYYKEYADKKNLCILAPALCCILFLIHNLLDTSNFDIKALIIFAVMLSLSLYNFLALLVGQQSSVSSLLEVSE